MKKSKHFRKDVILARIIAGVILLVLIALLVFGISLLEKSSGDDKNSQNSQNTQNSENLVPGDQDTESEDIQQTENSEEQEETPGTEENNDTTYEPDKVYVKTTAQLKLREEPNTKCTVLAYIPAGTKLEVVSPLENWYKVIYNGKTGYVSGAYVKAVE